MGTRLTDEALVENGDRQIVRLRPQGVHWREVGQVLHVLHRTRIVMRPNPSPDRRSLAVSDVWKALRTRA